NLNSVVMILSFVWLAGLAAICYACWSKMKFNKSWESMLDSLKDELNMNGQAMVLLLMDIAMLKADKVAGMAIGEIKSNFERKRTKGDFFKDLPEIIEGIHDCNHTIILNSDYATARKTIRGCMEIINEHAKVGTFEQFAELAVHVADAKERLTNSVRNVDGILYGLKENQLLITE
ncbi:MAG: hypothetical protein WC823_07490, partial [Parcubacteria group bacterium]